MLLLWVWPILGTVLTTHDIRKGILLQDHGEAVILDEYALIKINVSIIHENERNLKELRVVLENSRKKLTNPVLVRVIKGLLDSVDEELGVEKSVGTRKKRSLLPFVGQALKSVFGVSTEADHKRAQERINKLEEWAARQGSTYNTIIEGVNSNSKSIKEIADAFDDLVEVVKEGRVKYEKIAYFNELALECERHLQLHKDRMKALIKAQQGELSPALITPRRLKAIIDWTLIQHYHKPLVKDTWMYYPIASVEVIDHTIIVLIPFDGEHIFHLVTIKPFPIKVNDTPIIWNGVEKDLLLDERNARVINLGTNLAEKCVNSMGRFICNSLHAEEPLRALPCLRVFLEGASWTDNSCSFIEFNKTFTFQHVPPNIILFSNNSVNLNIICNGKARQTLLYNVQAVSTGCEIRIPDTFTYIPSRLFEYSMNTTHDIVNYAHQFAEPEIKLLRMKLRKDIPLTPTFWLTFTTSVSPYLPLSNFVFILLALVVGVLIIRYIIIKRVRYLRSLLPRRSTSVDSQAEDNSTEE